MMDCRKIDPDFGTQYYHTENKALALQTGRLAQFLIRHNFADPLQFILVRFVIRHNLINQLLTEDEQGCRGSEPCKPQDKR